MIGKMGESQNAKQTHRVNTHKTWQTSVGFAQRLTSTLNQVGTVWATNQKSFRASLFHLNLSFPPTRKFASSESSNHWSQVASACCFKTKKRGRKILRKGRSKTNDLRTNVEIHQKFAGKWSSRRFFERKKNVKKSWWSLGMQFGPL